MGIYYGTTKVKPSGFTKAYYGNTLVYQESAPVVSEPLWYSSTTASAQVYYQITGTINVNMQTSRDQITWTDWDGTAITLGANTKLYVRNTTNQLNLDDGDNVLKFKFNNGYIKAGGNIMSLLNNSITLQPYCFCRLFQLASYLQDISELQLPATTLVESCYRNMFYESTSLINACQMNVTAVTGTYSCMNMFNGCSRLITASNIILNASSINSRTYSQMFSTCTDLVVPPQINVSSFAGTHSLDYMFNWCRNLNISTTQGTAFFTMPDGYTPSNYAAGMFSGTQGGITTPTAGTTYYYS